MDQLCDFCNRYAVDGIGLCLIGVKPDISWCIHNLARLYTTCPVILKSFQDAQAQPG